MYRPEWGATRWTAIEQQAIKDRFADSGSWDFVTLIPLEKTEKLPDWFPPLRIWGDYARLGDAGLVATLQARVLHAGVPRQSKTLARCRSESSVSNVKGRSANPFATQARALLPLRRVWIACSMSFSSCPRTVTFIWNEIGTASYFGLLV
jgi:hypothetical protein